MIPKKVDEEKKQESPKVKLDVVAKGFALKTLMRLSNVDEYYTQQCAM